MAECSYCKAETELFISNTPVCLKCSGERESKRKPPISDTEIRNTLHWELQAAEERFKAALGAINNVTNDIPSGLPHPDGSQRIRNIYLEASTTRAAMAKAHNRLNDYLAKGIVPEDLKRSG
jgi:hypothetical protein